MPAPIIAKSDEDIARCFGVIAELRPHLDEGSFVEMVRGMQSQGYRIIPVNPNIKNSLGERAYPSLEEVPDEYQIVNVFRRSKFVGDLVSAVIASRANYVWMQLGVVDEQAARLMAEAGKTVVMDRCILQDHQRLIGRR